VKAAVRVILFFANSFSYTPFKKSPDHPLAASDPVPEKFARCVVVFYHCEELDQGREKELAKLLTKNIKWIARKFGTAEVVFHSFNHLSTSKAAPEVAVEIVRDAAMRLERVGFKVHETPFGYLNQWTIDVAGESLAKVYKEF